MDSFDTTKTVLPGSDAPKPGEQRFGKPQIIVAEDDPLTAQDLMNRLEKLNYEVLATTPRAEDAISLTENLKPDLVLMDIQLSGEMDGIDAAHQIRVFHIPVVFVTAHSDNALLERAKAAEPYGFVLKPYETGHLKIAVELGLHKHRADQERHRLYKRFQELLSSVKTLNGELSICCYCKDIKEHDTEQWAKIERYVTEHSNATLTHGMCPACFARVKKQIETIERAVPIGTLVLG